MGAVYKKYIVQCHFDCTPSALLMKNLSVLFVRFFKGINRNLIRMTDKIEFLNQTKIYKMRGIK